MRRTFTLTVTMKQSRTTLTEARQYLLVGDPVARCLHGSIRCLELLLLVVCDNSRFPDNSTKEKKNVTRLVEFLFPADVWLVSPGSYLSHPHNLLHLCSNQAILKSGRAKHFCLAARSCLLLQPCYKDANEAKDARYERHFLSILSKQR